MVSQASRMLRRPIFVYERRMFRPIRRAGWLWLESEHRLREAY